MAKADDQGNMCVVGGGLYHSTPPTFADGQPATWQFDSSGRIITSPRALTAATDAVTATQIAGTSGGWTPSSQTALSNAAVAIKGSAGQLGGLDIFNPNASIVYIQFFNVVAGSVTVGTTAPTFVKGIPAGAGANINWGAGIAFGAAISWAATTTPTGNTAPSSALTGFALFV